MKLKIQVFQFHFNFNIKKQGYLFRTTLLLKNQNHLRLIIYILKDMMLVLNMTQGEVIPIH